MTPQACATLLIPVLTVYVFAVITAAVEAILERRREAKPPPDKTPTGDKFLSPVEKNPTG